MAGTSKRAWKLEEFVAHAGAVNCLALGHKSGRVLVTGGEDKKVNTWAVGKPNCIMSLAGHSNPVDSVRFGHAEEMVIAGSMSGVLKIWDLEAAKIVRTLSGHKANVRCLDFHPYGDFVASGSQDTNVKIWDIRRKGCLFTYKGHADAISCLKFSPDGRWIVSGSADTLIKLWDLTAGKQVTEFTQHKGPISGIEFHPNEFLLASSSFDRTVKFWDLETFQMVSTTDEESSAVRTICFHPEGHCLYSGGENSLKVYSWEPARCLDSLAVGWGKVASIAVAESSKHSQLIGASFSQTNVSTFVVDLQRLGQGQGDQPPSLNNVPTPRKSFMMERPPTQCTSNKSSSVPKTEPCQDQEDVDEDLDQNIAHIKNEDAYQHIFQPKHTLRHSPVKEPFTEPENGIEKQMRENLNLQQERKNSDPRSNKVTPSIPLAKAVDPVLGVQPPQKVETIQPVQGSFAKPIQKPIVQPAQQQQQPFSQPVQQQQPFSQPAQQQQQQQVQQSRQQQHYQPARDPPQDLGLDPDAFLPPPVIEKPKSEQENEQSVVKSVLRGHDSMVTVLSNRSRNLDIIRALWSSGSVRTAFDSAVQMADQAVIVDILNIMNQKPALWNLELCAVVLIQCNKLMASKYENYVMCACNCVRLVLKNFTAVIKTNVTAPPHGVDLVREERYEKCNKCYQQLMEVRLHLEGKQSSSGKIGTTYREVMLMLNLLD